MPNAVKSLDEVFNQCEKTGAWYGDKITDVAQRNFTGDTVLHTVCSWGVPEPVRVLISAGADVNALGDHESGPLFNAVVGKNVEVIRLLLLAGANVKAKNSFGRCVLDYAKNVGASIEIVKLLEEANSTQRKRVRK